MFIPDRHRLHLVFQDFDAHAVRCHDERLIDRLLLPGSTATPAAFHWATRSWTLSTMKPTWFTTSPRCRLLLSRSCEIQVHVDAGEHDQRVAAGMNSLPPMARKSFLFAFDVLRRNVPVPDGHPDVVERGRLRSRSARRHAIAIVKMREQ